MGVGYFLTLTPTFFSGFRPGRGGAAAVREMRMQHAEEERGEVDAGVCAAEVEGAEEVVAL